MKHKIELTQRLVYSGENTDEGEDTRRVFGRTKHSKNVRVGWRDTYNVHIDKMLAFT